MKCSLGVVCNKELCKAIVGHRHVQSMTEPVCQHRVAYTGSKGIYAYEGNNGLKRRGADCSENMVKHTLMVKGRDAGGGGIGGLFGGGELGERSHKASGCITAASRSLAADAVMHVR